MTITTIIGIAASIFTGISLLPQLIKLVKEEKASDISMWMLVTLLAGLALWILYGVWKNDLVIIISNAVSLLLNMAIVFLNVYYKKKGAMAGPHFDSYSGLGKFIEEELSAGNTEKR